MTRRPPAIAVRALVAAVLLAAGPAAAASGLIVPVFSAGAVTIEKEQRTLPGLLTSLLSPA